jgi:CheY-like chemotaxis protein
MAGGLEDQQRGVDSKARNALDDHPFTGKTVLVVDDDPRNAFALSVLLERGKVEVIVAESGLAAIAVLDRPFRTDLVLMDIMMSDVDGCQTIQVIRTKLRFKTLAIGAVTAKAIDGERQRCLDVGAKRLSSQARQHEGTAVGRRTLAGRSLR